MADYGLITLRVDGVNISVRGSVQENPSRISSEMVINQDFSQDRTITPMNYRMTFSLALRDRAGNALDLDAIMNRQEGTVSFIGDAEKKIRTFSGTVFSGDPQVDLSNGEVTGLTATATGRIETNI
jgi:hypothetical protein